MATTSRPDDLAQIEARMSALQGELARLRRARGRPRRWRAVAPATLLTAPIPLATPAITPLNDLNPGSPHNGNVQAIADAGITTGCEPTEYCPNANVTRQEMASFLARTVGLGGSAPVTNAKTAQTATSAQTATNATQLGGVAAANYVRTNNRLLPIALATALSITVAVIIRWGAETW